MIGSKIKNSICSAKNLSYNHYKYLYTLLVLTNIVNKKKGLKRHKLRMFVSLTKNNNKKIYARMHVDI